MRKYFWESVQQKLDGDKKVKLSVAQLKESIAEAWGDDKDKIMEACDAIKEIASLYECDKDAKAFMEALDKSTTTLCEGLSETKAKDDDITIIASESKKKEDETEEKEDEKEEIDETIEKDDDSDEYLTRLSAIAKKKKMEESKKKEEDETEEKEDEEEEEVKEAVITGTQGSKMTFQRLQKVAPDIAAKVGEVNWNKVVDKMMSEEEEEEEEKIEEGKTKQAPIEMEESKKKDDEEEKSKKLEKIEENIIKRATILVV